MRIEEGFQQVPLTLALAYSDDHVLQSLLERLLPAEVHAKVDQELRRFEQGIAREIRPLASTIDTNPSSIEPSITQFDQWGQRVDILHTSEEWRALKGIAAEEGLWSIPHERKDAEFSRVHSFAKSYLFVPDSMYVGCPASMTDGAVRVLELAGTEEMKVEVLPRLLSREPSQAWTAGQWMTERPGGSDVSLTETTAVPLFPSQPIRPGAPFLLNGFKWFSSATDGDVALALARTGSLESGSKGLSLFLVKLRDPASGKTNGICVHRLKKKFGTKALPTAELELKDCVAQLVGPLGGGVKIISTVLNITRLHSSMSCISALRRGLDLAKAFARVRHYGGNLDARLQDSAMHTNALASSEIVQRALLHFFFGVVGLLGRSEALEAGRGEGPFTPDEQWKLRLLTPVIKSYAADLSTVELLRLMEALGGQGYMTENQFGRLIGDASVERIWEGTTSVLALDVVRVIRSSKGIAMESFDTWARTVLSSASSLPSYASLSPLISDRLSLLTSVSQRFLPSSSASFANGKADDRLPRPLLFLLGSLASTLYLLEHAVWSARKNRPESEMDEWVVERWADHGGVRETVRVLERLLSEDDEKGKREMGMEKALVYGLPGKKLASRL
ncbi:hypothetical protein JCM11251_006426 [Rhodosporidiobolus azoricus]